MDTSVKSPVFEFAGFRLDTGQRQLFGKDGKPVPLTGRVFETLLCLVKHQGTLLDKNVLINTVWPNVVVEDNNLNQTISALRKALGEGPGEHRFIVTVPGRGYQFVPAVHLVSEAAPVATNAMSGHAPETAPPQVALGEPLLPAALSRRTGIVTLVVVTGLAVIWGWQASTPTEQGASELRQQTTAEAVSARLPNSIAVLPFANLSPNPEDSYFAAGIHDGILNQLTKLQQMNVIARTTMLQYEGTTKSIPEIARELNVENVMEGTIQYANDRVRITTLLVDARSGANLWSDNYEREFSDIFAIQSDIAVQVANAMRTEFSPEEAAQVATAPTVSAEAYRLALSAYADTTLNTAEAELRAMEKIDRALALDPKFVRAWEEKSRLYSRYQVFFPERAAEGQAGTEMTLAQLQVIAPGSTAVLEARANLLVNQGRYLEAEAAFRNIPAAQRPTTDDYGFFRLQVGFAQEALRGLEVKRLETPLGHDAPAFIMAALNTLGDATAALALYTQTEQELNDWTMGRVQAVITYLGQGELDEVARVLALGLSDPVAVPLLEIIAAPERAQELLLAMRDDPQYNSNRAQTQIAVWAAYFDMPELALDTMRSRIAAVPTAAYVLWTPVFADVRQDPGFKTLVEDMGLVALWREYGWPQYCQPVAGSEDFTCQ